MSADALNYYCHPVSDFWWDVPNCPLNRTQCYDEVDFSLCFEDTVLLCGVVGLFCLVATIQFIVAFFCNKNKGPRKSISILQVTKILLLFVPLAAALCEFGYTVHQGIAGEPVAQYQYVSPVIIALTMALCMLVMYKDRRMGQHSSDLLFCFWLGLIIYSSIKLRTLSLLSIDNGGVQDVFRFATFVLQCSTYIAQFVLSLFPESLKKKKSLSISFGRRPSPEAEATFLSWITWWWQNGQMWQGWRRSLKHEDLADLNTEDKSEVVAPLFQKNWDQEIKKAGISFADRGSTEKGQFELLQSLDDSSEPTTLLVSTSQKYRTEKKKSNPSFVLALFKSFWKIFIAAFILKLIQDLLSFVNPQILKLMINFISDPNEASWHGYLYVVLLFLTASIQSLFLNQYFYRGYTLGMRVRSAIVAAVYRKSLRLSNRARRTSTVGEIVNLMSVDAQRMMDLMPYINNLWSSPLQIILSLVFLYLTMGPSIFAGFAVMVLMIPINAVMASYSKKLQAKQMAFKDSRIKLVNEVLNGIKVIKLYAWELPFQKLINGARDKELEMLKKAAYVSSTSNFLWMCSPFLVSLATFVTYSLVNLNDPVERLTADKAFVAVSLFNVLRFPLSMLPNLITMMIQANVSVKRLRKFFENEELDPDAVSWSAEPAVDSKHNAIEVANGTFSWDDDGSSAILSGVNLEMRAGELVAVVGQVGAGKSSLIQALLGEMEKAGGQVSIKGQVAVVPQQAWIQNTTVKDNILFGKAVNGVLYDKCVQACALDPDLEVLPGGDMTEIGEKGINLSGGQKQRVSLARAVYQEADIYLMDDPLSAVDSHVGKHIFDHVIGPNGMLKTKARVFVTHGIEFLPQVDKIMVMVNGKITETGTYAELIESNGAFTDFLRNYSKIVSENEEERDSEAFKQYQGEGNGEMKDHYAFGMGQKSSQMGKDIELVQTNSIFGISQVDSTKEDETAIDDRNSPIRSRQRSEESLDEESNLKRHSSQTSLLQHSSQSSLNEQPSKQSLHQAKDATKKSLITEETTQTGTIKLSVVIAYIKACTWLGCVLILFFYIGNFSMLIGTNFWLAEWSNAEGRVNVTSFTAITFCDHPDNIDVGCYLGVYAALGFTQSIFVLCGYFSLAMAGVAASRILHKRMLKNILRSPMSFFDTTPLGRVLNRFSKDIYTIDETIPRSLRVFLVTCLTVISTLLVIIIVTPIFCIVIVVLIAFYLMVQRFFVATSRQLKRLESVTRSPIYSHFQETLNGASTIRAYRKQERFMLDSLSRVDHNQIAYYPSVCANRWLAVRLEFAGNLVIFFAALFVVLQRNFSEQLPGINAGLAGLSISYALQVTQCLNCTVRSTSDLETNIVAVERTKEYAETPREAPAIVESHRPPPDWPSDGRVEFRQYSTRYREGLDLVLRDVSVCIPGGMKVGVVGRTGAGKSSLTLALFRIIELAGGSIHIDNINISVLGLDDLRSRITIIPQDPMLFSGTLRVNLDPLGSHSDQELWSALESAHLNTFVSGLQKGLQYEVAEGGENLSVGQCQLVCLARALLRKSKILVLDEATAAVDLETDDLVQKTLRSEFANSTIITIAHRLNTIMDYDLVMVLDSGCVVEYDSPTSLLLNQKSSFYAMAKEAGLV